MATILYGRGGSGKTAEIFRRIGENAAQNRRGQILLVPEQSGFITERQLCQACGNSISLFAEVMTFKSLAVRVFSACGGLAGTVLDEGGQLLLMRRAAEQVLPMLQFYQKHALSGAFLQKCVATLNEWKLARIAASDVAAWETEGLLGAKLADLALLYGAYEALLTGDLQDPPDKMTLLATVLEGEQGFFAKRHIYIDGFLHFNQVEKDILLAMLQSAGSVTFSLCMDESGHRGGVFAPVWETAFEIQKLCKKADRPLAFTNLGGPVRFAENASGLAELEQVLAGLPGSGGGRSEGVALFEAKTPYSEWEHTAGAILRLAGQGVRFGEIAVAMRDLAKFADAGASVFTRFGIPFFLDRRESAADKAPFKAASLSLLAASGRRKEAFLSLLKTGFSGLSPEEADRLENYALLWDVGALDWAKPFTAHPGGFGTAMTEADRTDLAEINALRVRFTAPLAHIPKEGTAKALCKGLYDAMTAVSLPEKIAAEADRLTATGDLRRGLEYGQLWQLFCDALDQIVLILGESVLSLLEFAELFALLLSKRTIGSIPAALDAVAVGEAGRMRPDHPKHLFFQGAVDGVFPQAPMEKTLLTPAERTSLAKQGVLPEKTAEEQLMAEQLVAYQILTAPSESLTVSYYQSETGGEAATPSYYIEKIRSALPGATFVTEEQTFGDFRTYAVLPCLSLAAGEAGRAKTEMESSAAAGLVLAGKEEELRRLEGSLAGRRGPLAEKTVIAGLFGAKPFVTASRLETYHGCPFSYFARYGLGARPREKAALGPADAGSLIHFVLAETALAVSQLPGGWKAVSEEFLEKSQKTHTVRYVNEYLGGYAEKSARFVWQLNRLSESLTLLLRDMRAEFSQSEFIPVAFELAFGLPGENALPGIAYDFGDCGLLLAGRVDRVDAFEKDGETFLRVADYKTGQTAFSFTDIAAGQGAQLLVYLFALCKSQNAKPAGVLYIPALSRFAMGSASGEGVRESAKRTGLLLGETEILAAMETPSDGRGRFIPVSYLGSGETRTLRQTNDLATAEEFALLRQHTEALLEKMAKGISQGEIECAPLLGDNFIRCDICDMRRVCQFDELRQNDKAVWMEKYSKKAFFEAQEKGEDHAVDSGAK